jgi:hypothetical protein
MEALAKVPVVLRDYHLARGDDGEFRLQWTLALRVSAFDLPSDEQTGEGDSRRGHETQPAKTDGIYYTGLVHETGPDTNWVRHAGHYYRRVEEDG